MTPFEIIVRVPKLTRDYLIFNPIAKKVLLVLASFFCNVISGLEVYLERAE